VGAALHRARRQARQLRHLRSRPIFDIREPHLPFGAERGRGADPVPDKIVLIPDDLEPPAFAMLAPGYAIPAVPPTGGTASHRSLSENSGHVSYIDPPVFPHALQNAVPHFEYLLAGQRRDAA
jgi:hypothetical protein